MSAVVIAAPPPQVGCTLCGHQGPAGGAFDPSAWKAANTKGAWGFEQEGLTGSVKVGRGWVCASCAAIATSEWASVLPRQKATKVPT